METVKSVSFTDTTCYVVTYRQTDPLYEIDLTDPKNPIIKDALHVDGYSSYGAAIVSPNGVKETYACPAPRAIVADVGVLLTAPPALTQETDWIFASA